MILLLLLFKLFIEIFPIIYVQYITHVQILDGKVVNFYRTFESEGAPAPDDSTIHECHLPISRARQHAWPVTFIPEGLNPGEVIRSDNNFAAIEQ
jgi:hypothetical protein